jgi:hypothetical protein
LHRWVGVRHVYDLGREVSIGVSGRDAAALGVDSGALYRVLTSSDLPVKLAY